MRIGIYDPYLDDLGGGEKYIATLAQCLIGRNEVDIFWDNQKEKELLSQRFGIDLSRVQFVSNIFAPKISFFSRLLKTLSYDAIIVLSDGSIPFVMSKKLFIHIQQPLQHMQNKGIFNWLRLSRVSGFFSNSVYTNRYIQNKFGVISQVLYPPVSLFPRNIKKKNCILHVGRFRIVDPLTHAGDFKKQQFMIDTFKKMIDKGLRGWEFILAVSVAEKDRKEFGDMQASAQGYPIRFEVNKTNKQLWEFYSLAKIYWHASGFGENLDTHPEYAEHFGISTVEAMGAGCVPVVINAGGQKEIVADSVNGLVWNSEKEFIDKTLTLIENPQELLRLSKGAKLRAKDFSEEKFCENLNNIL